MPLSDDDRKALTCDPSDYTYKYTISVTENSWLMVYHFEAIKLDVEVRVYHLDHERASKVIEHIRYLLSLRSEYLLSPEKVFNWCGELWLIFPYCIGGTLNEVLNRNYNNGLPNERVTARILLDVLEALEILHESNLCHRALATYNLFLEKETGETKLKDFTNVKLFEGDGIHLHTTIWKANKYSYLKPPEMLGYYASGERQEDVDERKADIFLFAVTALNLAYGSVPRSPYPNKTLFKPTNWIPPSSKDYIKQPEHVSNAFKAMLAPCLSKSTRARPSAKDLKKNKFFRCAASRAEVKELLCSVITVVDPPQINDVPPSQSKDFRSHGAGSSAWDFSNINRQLSGSRSLEKVLEVTTDVKGELCLDDHSEKSATPIEIRDVQAKVSGSPSPVAGNETVILTLNGAGLISPEDSTYATFEESKESDGTNTSHKAKTRFHVEQFDEHSDKRNKQLNPIDQAMVMGEQQTPHDPEACIIKRFHVKEDANAAALPVCDSSGSKSPTNAAVAQPTNQMSSTKKLASRFKVEDVQHVGVVPKQSAQAPWQQKKPTDWEVEDVCKWLQALGGDFKVYMNYFREAGIDGDMLHALTDDELDELRVTKKIHKRRILTSINKLQWS